MVLAIKWPYLGRSYQTKRRIPGIDAGTAGHHRTGLYRINDRFHIGHRAGYFVSIEKGTWIDQTTIIGTIAGISAPSFYMAIIIGYLFGMLWHHQTRLNLTGSLFDINSHTGERYLALKTCGYPPSLWASGRWRSSPN